MGEQKYSEEAEVIENKKKTKIDDKFREDLCELTKQQFKPLDVLIPAKYQQKLPEKGVITVFAKNINLSKFYSEPFRVKMLEKWNYPIGNGWLINAAKS